MDEGKMICPKCKGNLGICEHTGFDVGDLVELSEEGENSDDIMYNRLRGSKFYIKVIDNTREKDKLRCSYFLFVDCPSCGKGYQSSCGGHYIYDHDNKEQLVIMFKLVKP